MSDPTPIPPAASGLTDNNAGALAYLTVIPAIIFLVAAPYNQSSYIRFHAWQNICLCVLMFAISVIFVIPILGWIIFFVGLPVLFIAWLIALLQALKGNRYKLPIIGAFAEKQAGV